MGNKESNPPLGTDLMGRTRPMSFPETPEKASVKKEKLPPEENEAYNRAIRFFEVRRGMIRDKHAKSLENSGIS